ncbi:MAG: DinB family protein [Bacteroidota bacterium]
MRRTHFLKSILGLGLLSTWGCQTDNSKASFTTLESGVGGTDEPETLKELRQELKAAWRRSESITLTSVEQMPDEFFTFKYTDEAMTFAEQWRHCVIYTCGQLAGRAGIKNPYKKVKLPVQMPKEDIIKELKNMYAFVRQSIEELPGEKLLGKIDFAGEAIPLWRLIYSLENHIIHHRGQCVVYLRLNGVVPKGYYGW